MRQLWNLILAVIAAIVLVVLGLWLWLVLGPQVADGEGARWLPVIHCGSIALLAAAQTVALGVVARNLFRSGVVSRSVGALTALLCVAALVSTLTLI